MLKKLISKLNKIFSNKKLFLSVVLFCVVFSFLPTNIALADADPVMASLVTVLGWIAYAFAYIIGLILTLITYVLIEVAQYSDIINVEAVKQGWVIVRDLCNMFFILILLVIAFATILKIENYNVKKLLPKLLIMAVLINFSRTICGLIIDFGQVVMLTFVNGFSEYGGANFVKMFQMKKYLSMETFTEAKSTSNLGTAGAIIAGLLAMIITTIVMVTMLVVLIIRLVLLWVYVIVSPIAFLASAFPFGEKYSKKWWSDFSEQVIIGPILAFFIWLALTTAESSAGKFQTSSSAGVSQLCAGQNELFCSGNFQTYIITIGLLVGGLIITKEFSGELGKVAGKGFEAVKGKYGMTPLRWGRERWDSYTGMRESKRKEKAATGFLGGAKLLAMEGKLKQGVGGLVSGVFRPEKGLPKEDVAAENRRIQDEAVRKHFGLSEKVEQEQTTVGEANWFSKMAGKAIGGVSRWGAEEAAIAERYKAKKVSEKGAEIQFDSEEDIKNRAHDITAETFSRIASIFEGMKKGYFQSSEIKNLRSVIKNLSGNNKPLISKFEAGVDQYYHSESLLNDEQKAKKINDGDWTMKDLGLDSLENLIAKIVENTKPGSFQSQHSALSKGKKLAVEKALRGVKNEKTGEWDGGLINDLDRQSKSETDSRKKEDLMNKKFNAQMMYAKIKPGGIHQAFGDDNEGKIKFIQKEKELSDNESSIRLDAKDLTKEVIQVLPQAHMQNLLFHGDSKQLEALKKTLQEFSEETMPESIKTIMKDDNNTVGKQLRLLRGDNINK